MALLRFVFDNNAGRASSFTASAEAGALVVENLLTRVKTQVWRSTATTATITLQYSSPEYVGCVALPFSNLTSAATMRVRLYTETTDTTAVVDTTAESVLADLIDNVDWGYAMLGANAFAYGGGAYAVQWMANTPCKKVVIDLSDSLNPAGYLEASSIVVGGWWSPENGCEYGASVTPTDKSSQSRSDAGDLYVDRGTMHNVLSFNTTMMPSTDKTKMYQMLKANGLHTPVFCSLIPEADEPTDTQVYQVYGLLSKSASIQFKFLNQFDTAIEIEEI